MPLPFLLYGKKCDRSQQFHSFIVGFLLRREVYRILQEEGIDLPRYAVLNRDPNNPEGRSLFVCCFKAQKKFTNVYFFIF